MVDPGVEWGPSIVGLGVVLLPVDEDFIGKEKAVCFSVVEVSEYNEVEANFDRL